MQRELHVHIFSFYREHNVGDRLQCNVCNKTFMNPRNLREHLTIHTGQYDTQPVGMTHKRSVWHTAGQYDPQPVSMTHSQSVWCTASQYDTQPVSMTHSRSWSVWHTADQCNAHVQLVTMTHSRSVWHTAGLCGRQAVSMMIEIQR